jgi:hypothetical protein
MTSELEKFKRVQYAFANHIKSPAQVDCPSDVDDRHMAIYRDLFFNNIMGFLSGGFPVLAEIIGKERWQIIGRKFFSSHYNKTPYFLEISREFLSFLEHEYIPAAEDPIYLLELAHYEWLELYVDVEPENMTVPFDSDSDSNSDVLANVPFLSPVVEGCLYQFPVHQISAENSSPEPKPSALIVYRGRADEVGFAETNPFTLQLLPLLKEGGRTGIEVVNLLLQQNGLEGQKVAYNGGIQTLEKWQALGIIWGAVTH